MHDELPAELKARIEEFYSRAEKIPDELAMELDKAPPPALIYHYTDGKGLRGIIESGCIRLADIFYLNDPAELRHGVNFTVEALDAAAEIASDEVKFFARQFRRVSTAGGIEASAHFFVASFSSAGDDLGQWRAYADDGRGYALGFDGKALEDAFAKKNGVLIPGNTTFPVVYDDVRLKDMQQRIVAEVIPLISAPRGLRLEGQVISNYRAELSVYLTVPVIRTALFFKHKAYLNEAEYRFMQVQRGDRPAENVLYLDKPYSLTRYINFDWKSAAPAALKEIVIGPTGERTKAERYAIDCLRAFHPSSSTSIRRSEIPYRSR